MRIHVDDKSYQVAERDQSLPLLEVLLHLGFDIPYFCWHPAMGSVGACRQCAVRLFAEDDDHGRIEMSCMTQVKDGLRLSVDDEEVREFRKRVIEWLMTNHPHDCPICDEGGECHLQDMTVMVGHVYRRFRYRKRTFRDQNLGPFINHEMNRCIQCYRCFRFYREFAGGRDFDILAWKNHTYFGRYEDGKLESEFSGNLVEVCPTGVFTDKTFKQHYTRKWDLATAPSICVHCGLGCNIIPGARYGMLRRIRARFHPDVNGYFICDRGRFGYGFANAAGRYAAPLVGRKQKQVAPWKEAVAQAQQALSGCRRVIGLGSPRASLESNYALRTLVGEEAFYAGIEDEEAAGLWVAASLLQSGLPRAASLREVEGADAILILGTDPTNEAPMLDLAVRRGTFNAALSLSRRLHIPDWEDFPVRNAIEDARGRLYIASSAAMKLDDIAVESWRLAPPDLAELAWDIAAAVNEEGNDDGRPAARVAADLAGATRPLIIASAAGDPELMRAASRIAHDLSTKRDAPCLLAMVVPECNSMGLALMDAPSLRPAFQEIEEGRADGLIVLENDLLRRADPERVAGILDTLSCLVVLEHVATGVGERADYLFPVTTFAESTGTLVNNEGRAQRFFAVFRPSSDVREAWRVLRDLRAARVPKWSGWASCDEVTRALADELPAFAGIAEAAPPESWRDRAGRKVARLSFRHSGRTAEHANVSVFDRPPAADPDSPFAFTMEGFQQEPPPALIPRYWRPGWNSPQALTRFALEASGPAPDWPLGKRLLEPKDIPPPEGPSGPCPALEEGELWLVPQAQIFGSEELSRRAPPIAEVMPPPLLRLHPDDAAARGLADGERASIVIEDRSYDLDVRLDATIAPGVALIPPGHRETAGLAGCRRAKIGRSV